MTSFRQIDANRRNASKSTGPTTEEGKRRSRCNAVRHGLTAETVIGALEDAEDCKAFEAAVIADYDAHSTVERELVLRLAKLSYGGFAVPRQWKQACSTSRLTTRVNSGATLKQRRRKLSIPRLGWPHSVDADPIEYRTASQAVTEAGPNIAPKSVDPATDLARCFLRLANLPTYPLDRLSRYEAILWRQAGQILFALDALDRRKPQSEGAVSVSVAGKTCRPTDATTIELPDPPIYAIDAELDRLPCTYNPEVLCRDVGGDCSTRNCPAFLDADQPTCRGTRRQLPVFGSMLQCNMNGTKPKRRRASTASPSGFGCSTMDPPPKAGWVDICHGICHKLAMSERYVKLFKNGRNQAVRIPREFELPGENAIIRKEGQRLIIEAVPPKSLLAVLATLPTLDEDFPPIEDLPAESVDL